MLCPTFSISITVSLFFYGMLPLPLHKISFFFIIRNKQFSFSGPGTSGKSASTFPVSAPCQVSVQVCLLYLPYCKHTSNAHEFSNIPHVITLSLILCVKIFFSSISVAPLLWCKGRFDTGGCGSKTKVVHRCVHGSQCMSFHKPNHTHSRNISVWFNVDCRGGP